MKRTIAIVGTAGEVAGDLIPGLSNAGFEVLLISRQQEGLRSVEESGQQSPIRLVDCAREGCWEADIILLTVAPELEEAVSELKEVATQKIVLLISGNNDTEFHYQAIRKLQQWLPYSKIISALHDKNTSGMHICGEDSSAAEDISTIFRAAGFEPLIAAAPCEGLSSSSLN